MGKPQTRTALKILFDGIRTEPGSFDPMGGRKQKWFPATGHNGAGTHERKNTALRGRKGKALFLGVMGRAQPRENEDTVEHSTSPASEQIWIALGWGDGSEKGNWLESAAPKKSAPAA